MSKYTLYLVTSRGREAKTFESLEEAREAVTVSHMRAGYIENEDGVRQVMRPE